MQLNIPHTYFYTDNKKGKQYDQDYLTPYKLRVNVKSDCCEEN